MVEELPESGAGGGGIKEKKKKPTKKRAVPTHNCCYEPASQRHGSESQRCMEGISEQMHGRTCAALQPWQSQPDVCSSSPDFNTDTEILRNCDGTVKKELRLGNVANKAVQGVKSVGSSAAPGEGLLTDAGGRSTAMGQCVSSAEGGGGGPKVHS